MVAPFRRHLISTLQNGHKVTHVTYRYMCIPSDDDFAKHLEHFIFLLVKPSRVDVLARPDEEEMVLSK